MFEKGYSCHAIKYQNFGKYKVFGDSKIADNERDYFVLKKAMPQGKDFFLSLIYRGSEHGWDGNTFQRYCYEKSNTLVLMKNTMGKRFGGYRSVSWSGMRGRFINDPTAFLFSLDRG